MDQTTRDLVSEGSKNIAGLLKPIIYYESKIYVIYTMGGVFIIALMKAFLFRFENPDKFYEILALLVAIFMGTLFWFPPKLVLSSEGVTGSSFGRKWLELPWAGVASIDMFRTPVVQVGTTRTGGRRALGFRLKPEYQGKIRPKSGLYGYDAVIVSMWNFSIDRVAEQCVAFWHAKGGVGELVNRLEDQDADHLKLSSL